MLITEVKIVIVDRNDLKAYASITIDDCFVVRGLKVIDTGQGCFVAMPNRKDKKGDYKDIVFPIKNETRLYIEDSILQAYREAIDI